MLPSVADIVRACYGMAYLVRRHPDAEQMFDATPAGFWRSMFAAVICLPAHAVIIANGVVYTGEHDYGFRDGVSDLMVYVIIWLAYPVLIANVAPAIGRRDRFLPYIVPYNWFAIPISYLFALISGLALQNTIAPGFQAGLTIAVYIATTLLLIEVARRLLDIGTALAFGVVVLDLLFTAAIARILGSLFGRG